MGVIAAQIDDTFLISVDASPRGFTNNNVKLKVTRDDIRSAKVAFDFILEKKPAKTALLQNYPNPFNPETWIPYQLSAESDVTVEIYDVHGRLVRVFDFGMQPAGSYVTKDRAVYWNGENEFGERVASGVYFYRLKAENPEAGAFSEIRRLMVVK